MSLAIYLTDMLYFHPQMWTPFLSFPSWFHPLSSVCALVTSGIAARDTLPAFIWSFFHVWRIFVTVGLKWNTIPAVSKAPLCYLTCWKLMGDSESFNWCFMGSMALRQCYSITIIFHRGQSWTLQLLPFEDISLRAVSVCYVSLVCTSLDLCVTPNC